MCLKWYLKAPAEASDVENLHAKNVHIRGKTTGVEYPGSPPGRCIWNQRKDVFLGLRVWEVRSLQFVQNPLSESSTPKPELTNPTNFCLGLAFRDACCKRKS